MKTKSTKLGQALIQSLSEAVAFEQGKKNLKTVVRELAPPAPEFSKAEIKNIRIQILDFTQLEFASVLNVDVGSVRHWEQGIRKPSGSVNRLLEIISLNPDIIEELKGA